MNRVQRWAAVAIVLGLMAGSTALLAGEMKADAATASEAITRAEAAQKKADSVNGEWRDTGKFIKNAKKAVEEGDYAKAIRLANKAESEGNLGYQQAVSQSKLEIPSYLKAMY
ncbi:SoxXA-binding protein [Sedimenticola selenatireducens]|uniref:SoxXA-binding protein n=1 Tax=Sedimenticola selenatireducens TaxID=191960 RepID=A0A558DMV7_9GAMM|nr:SoxXA-binding protein [Sedimenticola selenatireducens]TVO74829.1 SoxXA-binding protein [Sedimenticola selenatireducens]TVT62364.1 MAG: SoxXA-binding protein [Sedimenticola selenatireducens]